MSSVLKLISLEQVERVFEYGAHHSGSSDRKVLERFHNDVVNDRMSPDALLFYGSCLEHTDVKHIKSWVEAMLRLIQREPTIAVRIRLRHGKSFSQFVTDTRDTDISIRAFMSEVGTRLRYLMPTEPEDNPKLVDLVRRLDCPCS